MDCPNKYLFFGAGSYAFGVLWCFLGNLARGLIHPIKSVKDSWLGSGKMWNEVWFENRSSETESWCIGIRKHAQGTLQDGVISWTDYKLAFW